MVQHDFLISCNSSYQNLSIRGALVSYRKEEDTMGVVLIPEEAYFGAQTQRAVENFPISNLRFPPCFIRTLALIKHCAAAVNLELGLLDRKLATPIMKAAMEIE